MPQVRWSPQAADDLTRIVEYIRRDNTEAARRVAADIFRRAGALERFPNRGRPGRVEGTRELPWRRFLSYALVPLPFIVVYRVLEHGVEISNILHGAQRWP